MSTQDGSHVSLSMPPQQTSTSNQDNFQFMSDTFTLPQNGQTNSTQIPIGQNSGKNEFESNIRHRGWIGGTLDKQGYGWLLETTIDDDNDGEEHRPLL